MDIKEPDVQTTVLILDDHSSWRKILSEIVIELGFTPIPVSDLRSAQNVLEKMEIDIVLTDIFLDEVHQGLWLLENIRELRKKKKRKTFVVAISGNDRMGGKQTQELYSYSDIVMDFIFKDDFSKKRLQNTLKVTITRNDIESYPGPFQTLENKDLNYTVESQLWYAPEFPATTEVNYSRVKSLSNEIDVILITATDEEIKAVMRLVKPYPLRKAILKTTYSSETYYLGKFGKYNAVITKCDAGAINQGSVILATEQAQRVWLPRAVIMVGFAFGRSSQEQGMADVMVASQVISYEQQRIGEKIVFRGPISPTNQTLLNRFKNVPTWHFDKPDGKTCKIHFGPILSGEKLVDDPQFKAELFDQYPQAIGGEMEGAGLCAATGKVGIAWILVKAISDWGDGKKHNKHQPLAAAAAASLVYQVLSQKTALNSIIKHKISEE